MPGRDGTGPARRGRRATRTCTGQQRRLRLCRGTGRRCRNRALPEGEADAPRQTLREREADPGQPAPGGDPGR